MRCHLTLSLILTLALTVLLIGCGQSPPPQPPPAAPDATAASAPAAPLSALSLPAISAAGWEIGAKPDWSSVAGPIEVTFWHAIAQQHEIALNEIVERFEAIHPNITINAVQQGAYADLFLALVAAMSTPSRPVMSQTYESWTSQFMARDLVVPAQAFIDADADFGDAELADFFPSFLTHNTWGNVITTLPFNKSLYLLFANLDLLEAHGLGVPQTWEELRAAAITLTDAEARRSGFGVRPRVETFTPLFLMSGGEYVTDGQLNIDSPAAVETLDLLIQMVHHDEVTLVESAYLTSAFGQQIVALFIGSSAGIPYTDTAVEDGFRWSVAPLPSHGDHPRRVLSQGTNVGIFADHPPEAQWAAWEFLKFLTDAENSAAFASATGFLPVRRSSLTVPSFQEFLVENPNIEIATSQLEFAAFEPRMPVWETIRSTLNRQVGQLVTNPTAEGTSFAQRMQREAMDDVED